MNRLCVLLIIGLLALPAVMVCAQETSNGDKSLEFRLQSIKNPFNHQLPIVEKEIEIIEAEPQSMGTKKVQPDEEVFGPSMEPGPEDQTNSGAGPAEPLPEITEPEEIVPLPPVNVTGVIWNSDRPQAIINDHIVNVGDTISGIKITEINKTSIEGLFSGRTVTIQTQRSQL